MNAPTPHQVTELAEAFHSEALREQEALHTTIRVQMESFIDDKRFGGIVNLLEELADIMHERTKFCDDYETAHHALMECAGKCDLRYAEDV